MFNFPFAVVMDDNVPIAGHKTVSLSWACLGALSMSHPGLSSGLLDRLIGIARQTGIHLTELPQLGNMGFIDHSCVLRLDLDHLLERLCTQELFESTGTVLERLLRIAAISAAIAWNPLFASPKELTMASKPSLPAL
jgi:hypothetical protein